MIVDEWGERARNEHATRQASARLTDESHALDREGWDNERAAWGPEEPEDLRLWPEGFWFSLGEWLASRGRGPLR